MHDIWTSLMTLKQAFVIWNFIQVRTVIIQVSYVQPKTYQDCRSNSPFTC